MQFQRSAAIAFGRLASSSFRGFAGCRFVGCRCLATSGWLLCCAASLERSQQRLLLPAQSIQLVLESDLLGSAQQAQQELAPSAFASL